MGNRQWAVGEDAGVDTAAISRAENVFVAEFIKPEHRDRWLESLADTKRRRKLTGRLAHKFLDDAKPQRVNPIPSSLQKADRIAASLLELGAPNECYVIAQRDLDHHRLLLRETLEATVGFGYGTILICIPDRLAYYEGEEPNERYILRKEAQGV